MDAIKDSSTIKGCHFYILMGGIFMEEKRNLYGYIRVSTLAQHDDRQWIAMDEFGVSREFVFADKQSGKDFNRPFRLREKSLPGFEESI